MEIAALGLRVDGVDNVGKASQSLDGLKKSAQGAEGAFDSLSNDSAKTTRSIKQVGDQSDRTSSKISALGGAAKAAGGVLAAAFSVAAVSGGIKASLRTYADFESQMAKVGAVSRASEKDFKALTETAKRLGAETEFSASQAGAGLEFLARAGWSAKESIAAMPAVLNLATSAAMDLGKAADVASNIMSAFGIAATDAAQVTDVLAAASSRANTDVAQLGDAMSYVGPIAASLKISMGDTAAAIGALSDAGIQGSSAGTGLRRVLSSLANPTKASADEIRSLGISMADVNPQANSLSDIIDTLAKGGIDAASAMKIFGDQGGPALLALVDQRSKVRELSEALGDVSGEAQRMADIIGDTLDGDLLGLSSALEGVRISLGDAFSSTARELVQKATSAVRSFGDNISTVLATVTLAAKLTTAYVVAVYAMPAAKMAASAATAAYTAVLQLFSARVALTTKTLLSMRTALNVVFAAFAGWEIGTYLRNEFEFAEKAGIKLMSWLHTFAVSIAGEFAVMSELVKFALTNPFDFARGVIADFFGWIAGLGKSALKLIGFEDLAAGIDTEFKGIRGAVGSEHAAMLKEMRATTKAEVAGIKNVYAEMFADVGKGGKEAASTIEAAKKKTEELGGSIKKVSNDAVKDVGGMSKAFGDLMARLFPAQAAQAKYNAELAILTKHLRGNQLAKAVSELTKQFTGGDADGAAKAIEEYNKNLKTLVDRLNPAAVASRTFKEEQELLLDAIKRTGDPTGELARSLEELERQYSETSRVTNEWTRWTESALDRVDGAFADAWRNIGDGFKGFRDNLTNAFKQMLAELAHMAITKPIVMQIGAALGIGGGGAVSGIGGMISSAGGGGLGGIANLASSAYSALTGWGPAAYAGFQTGGISGALSGVGSYYGGMFSGGLGGFQAGVQGAYLAPGLAGPTTAGAGGLMGAGSSVGSAAAYAPWLSGIGGAFMGYQNSGLKGAAAGGLGGFGGAKIGASLGANLGPVGAAVGAIAGGILGALGGSKLFGGKWQTKDGGLSLGVQGGDFAGQQYEYQKKKGGLFRSNKKRTRYSALDAEMASVLQEAYGATELAVGGLYEQLGYTINDATLSGLNISATQISTLGKTGEQIEEAIGKWLGTVAERMNTELNRVFATGLDYDLAGMQEFVGNLIGVNEVLRYLDVGMFDTSVAGGKLAETLSELSGGLESLSANAATYYDNFFSAEEKTEDAIDSITRTFKDAEVTLTDSREAYRKAVESIDLTSESGQDMFTKMMALAGHAAQYFDIIEQRAATYYENFFSAEEKTEDAIEAITSAFKDAEVTLTDSRESYRKAVEAIDLTSDAGQEMFTKMMALAGHAAQYFDIIEQQAAQAAANAVNASMVQANSAYSALERSIAAERKRITAEFNAAAQAQQAAQQAANQAAASRAQAQAASLTASLDISKRLIDIFKQIDSAIKGALERLMSTDAAVVAMRREQSLGIVRGALDTARSGGSLAGIDGLADAITASSVIDSASYKTSVELHRDQGRTANLISELGELNGKQLSTEEKTHELLSAQLEYTRSIISSLNSGFSGVSASLQAKYDADMAALDKELDAAKLQMDAMNGVDNSIMSVREAVDAMNASVVAAIHQQNKFMTGDTSKTDLGSSAATSSDAGLEATIKRMYLSSLGYEADEEGVKHWTDRIKSGESLSILQSALTLAAASAAAPKIPAFASGGFHGGGLRIVGENGPELEATGSSRIFNAAQTEQILSGSRSNGSTSSAIARLENTIAQQAEALRAIAKHTRKTSQQTETLERWDFDGLPQERTA